MQENPHPSQSHSVSLSDLNDADTYLDLIRRRTATPSHRSTQSTNSSIACRKCRMQSSRSCGTPTPCYTRDTPSVSSTNAECSQGENNDRKFRKQSEDLRGLDRCSGLPGTQCLAPSGGFGIW